MCFKEETVVIRARFIVGRKVIWILNFDDEKPERKLDWIGNFAYWFPMIATMRPMYLQKVATTKKCLLQMMKISISFVLVRLPLSLALSMFSWPDTHYITSFNNELRNFICTDGEKKLLVRLTLRARCNTGKKCVKSLQHCLNLREILRIVVKHFCSFDIYLARGIIGKYA